jgi:hypothetical protein
MWHTFGPDGTGVVVKRIALLLSATALVGSLTLTAGSVYAQIIVGGKPVKADDGDSGISAFGGTNADNGVQGPTLPPHTNNSDITSVGTAYFGDARGGDGGDGGTAFDFCATGFPPFCLPGIEGGDGGDGGHGGEANLTNTAILSTSGSNAHGIQADANGGSGGHGAWAAELLLTDGGDGGNGGNGGTASAIAADISHIRTSGTGAHGIFVNASGGDGGDGGTAVGGVGSGSGGNGGRGGAGGTAFGENRGFIETQDDFAKGILVRSAGGVAGDGASGGGLIAGGGGNGGLPTVGGNATGVNSGIIITNGNFSHGMLVQSIGGGGGDGGGAFGIFGGGGAGVAGNDGGTASGRNDGSISTRGQGAIGMLVESIGGGGGDGGGSVGAIALGGAGDGGGDGGAANGYLGGTILTGIDGNGDGAYGVLIQSVGGGGGNGGYAVSVPVLPASVAVGGTAGSGSIGGTVTVRQSNTPARVETNGMGAIGIVAQSVGGGGGSGGSATAINPVAAIGIGGRGGAGGNGGLVDYDVGDASVVTRGDFSTGLLIQSVGGGGGNGAFALTLSGAVSVGIGGSGTSAGSGGEVRGTTGGIVDTFGFFSHGIVAQSVGGGGGNGGATIAGGLGVNVSVGGDGDTGGLGGKVTVTNSAAITTHGVFSHGLFAQSLGGGGGSGGYSISAGLGPAVSVAGSGDGGGDSDEVRVTNSGAIRTYNDLSVGLLAQSVGGGGGDGGFSLAGGTTLGISVGGSGALGGSGNLVDVTNTANIATGWIETIGDAQVIHGNLAHGVLAQSVGGGGGSGGSAHAVAVGLAAVTVSVGGGGGAGGAGGDVIVRHEGDITVHGAGAKGILAQSIGGNGGNGGEAWSFSAAANIYPYPAGAIDVAIGGAGAGGGNAGAVEVTADGMILSLSGAEGSGGIVAQSVGGRGGNGGRSTTISGSFSPTVSINLGASIGGKGGGGGQGNAVTVDAGTIDPASVIVTTGHNAHGILAQSVGGGGGNGGDSFAGAGGLGGSVTVSATVTVGGWGGDGNSGGTVDVTNAARIWTEGNQSNAILAQSIGGGGGTGGSASGTTASVSTGSNVNVSANVAVGGQGGDGNDGGAVTVTNSGLLETFGDFSAGIFAQSIGGGGGIGGSANAKALDIGSSEGTTINANLAIGGGGGAGGGDRDDDGRTNAQEWEDFALAGMSSGMKVTVGNSGTIVTRGFGSAGIVAQSVGGGGGHGGAATAGNEAMAGGGATVSVGAGIGLAGGMAGNGGEVEVTNSGLITTYGDDANGITASSVGGGGGIGGAASSGVEAEYAIGGAIGGFGGAGGEGRLVEVFNQQSGAIRTLGDRSIGIFAQSIGGSGGSGGGGESNGSGDTLTVTLSVGGFADSAGAGGAVVVENAGTITTGNIYLVSRERFGHNAHGIMAQSIGGGGGLGGAAGTTSEEATYQINLGLSGAGGKGGVGGDVAVTNFASGEIITFGDNSYGIFAQSIGGGGGTAGAGDSQSDGGDIEANIQMGGTGGGGAHGGTVTVTNYGDITTFGLLSHGIFAQSVGGGGGAASSVSTAATGDMTIGFALPPPDPNNPIVGAGADGGDVFVRHNSGTIFTEGDGATGIFAQSVGGSGGYGGTLSDASAGSDSYSLQVGVDGGFGGNGGAVDVLVAGDIHTTGRLAHGVVAQSIGGGGGYGTNVSGTSAVALGIGGNGGAGGDGGDVRVERTGAIITEGEDSIAIIAQSVGGGGGFAGTSFGRFTTGDDGSGPDSLTVEMLNGSQGVGGEVTIIQTGEITTIGTRSHGIVAQAVGGGGGAVGGVNSGAGSAGGAGNAAAATATANSQVAVHGATSYALFGQSATGVGNSGAVALTAQSNLFAQGAHSVAAYGESTGSGEKGDITIDLYGPFTIGGGQTGVAAMMVGGANNTITNRSLLYAMGQEFDYIYFGDAPVGPVPVNAVLASLIDDFSPMSITGTGGNDAVVNQRTVTTLGRIIGNIDLGGGLNTFGNGVAASMVGLQSIDLGGGLFTNDGLMTNQGIGAVAAIDLGGGFTQTGTGSYVTDLDLDTQTNDHLALTATGDFAGEAPLNFLSIDRLFGQYVLSRGTTMVDSGISPSYRPTVGFDFRMRVDDDTDLVLYADKPMFEDIINDPASGVRDPGAVQMARYFDGLEGVMSPADAPSELARLINMLRFLPDEETFGETMMRLTPHYAVHTLEMTNRSTDEALASARDCFQWPAAHLYDRNCVWATMTPKINYTRDTGTGTALRDDVLQMMSAGGLRSVTSDWSVGAAFAHTEFTSDISFKNELLSELEGKNWQAHALASYSNGPYFADFAAGGGIGRFKGTRDTTVDQVSYIPGETLEGVYLPDLLLDGIGNSVTFNQQVKQFNMSGRVGYVHQMDNAYLKPSVLLDGRWLNIEGQETGSVAAFTFSGTSNFYYSATPTLEIGTDLKVDENSSVRLYAQAGVELSNRQWAIEGQFTAAEGLGAPPLRLTQSIDSPLYRVGGGLEWNVNGGVGISMRYSGAFGRAVEQQSIRGTLKARF